MVFGETELSSPPSPSRCAFWIWLSVNSSPSGYLLPPERSVIGSAEAQLEASRRRSGAVASTSYCDASCHRKHRNTCRSKKPVLGGLRLDISQVSREFHRGSRRRRTGAQAGKTGARSASHVSPELRARSVRAHSRRHPQLDQISLLEARL